MHIETCAKIVKHEQRRIVMKSKHNRMPERHPFRFLKAVLVASLFLVLSSSHSQAAGLLVADGGFGGVLEIVEHDVKVTINNGIAVTEVSQVFLNMENRQVEALYTFPVPKGASVSNFSMWINGKEMIGEVVEKKRAREIYNSYKQRRRDPGLLEQTNYKTFEMRIFPIGPKVRQKVQITYYQELEFDHDWATYVYPLATATRGNIDNRVQGRFSVSMDVKSAIPITSMKSPSHEEAFLMVRHADTYHEASLENRNGDLARDVVLAYQASRPVTGLDLLASNVEGEDGYFSLTLTAGKELEKIQTGDDYVFILDISGSMADDGKLNTSVNSLQSFVSALGQEDRFEIIAFNKRPFTLFNKLVNAGDETKSQAASFLQLQEARGGTFLQSALAAAYKYKTADRALNTVILSDGMTEQQERRVLMEMIRSRPGNVRVFCIGVGNEINRSLLRQMAEDAGGLAAFLSRGDDFERQAKAFRRKLMHPVATNLQVNFSGIDVYDVEPSKIPNLYHGMPVRIYGRYKQSGTTSVQVQSEVNGRTVSTPAELVFPSKDTDNPEIERMWAWHRMEQLKREHEMNSRPDLVDEIIRLGEGYSITSEYTSFLVLENDGEYKRWKIERLNASRIRRDREAQARVREQLETLRKKSMVNIGPADEGSIAKTKTAPARPIQTAQAPPVNEWRKHVRTDQADKRSFNLPSLGGGGAMDPVSALVGIALAGGAFAGRRRKK